MENVKKRTSPLWYAFGGALIGVVFGVLYAPKKGSELRADIDDLMREGREKKAELIGKLKSMIPLRVKAAAALGALRAGGIEVIEIVKEDLNHNGADKS